MLNLAAVRRAIEDVERAADGAAPPRMPVTAAAASSTLARLYRVYAQGVLESHGIQIDLDELCGQCCRDCPDGRCARAMA